MKVLRSSKLVGGGNVGGPELWSSQHSVSGLVLTSPVDGWMSPALGSNRDKGMSPAPRRSIRTEVHMLDRQRLTSSARIMDLYDVRKTPEVELVGAYPVGRQAVGENHWRENSGQMKTIK